MNILRDKNSLTGDCSICVLLGAKIKQIAKKKYNSDTIAKLILKAICVGKYDIRRATNNALNEAYLAVESEARRLANKAKQIGVTSFESQVANILKTNWDNITEDSCERLFTSLATDLLVTVLENIYDGSCKVE